MIESHKFTTKNGLKVLLIKRPEKYTVGISFIINAGSIYESQETSGICHFFEHLYFGGTKSFPSEELLRERFQETGVSFSARTLQDMIEVYGTSPKPEIKASLRILREMVFESLLDLSVIEKERQIILSEISMRKDDNYTYLWDEQGRMRFKKGISLRLPIGGTEESVGKIKAKQISEFYKKFNTSKNSMLIIGSSLEFKKVEKLVRDIFEVVKPGKVVPLVSITNLNMSDQEIKVIERSTDHFYLNISFPTEIGRDIKENWKSGFLSILFNEELNKELRIKKGLVYNVGVSQSALTKSTGITVIQTSFSVNVLPQVLDIIFSLIEKFKKGEIDMKTLNRLRTTGNRILPMAFDSLPGAMGWVIGSYYYEGKIYSPEESIAARNNVTKKHIHNAANEVFDFKKMNALGLGPIKEEKFKKELSKYI